MGKIEIPRPPNISVPSKELMELAKKAIEEVKRRHNVDIDEWAELLAQDLVDASDDE